jgi:high-affinity Fe2+/Pb2+ permease
MKLFITGFTQVFLVAMNTYLISKAMIIPVPVFVVGFLISFVWTFNVQKIAISNNAQRVVYSMGAASGAVSGLLISLTFWK